MTKSSKKILIVEDDMILSMVLERMISKMNHQPVAKVISGEEAVKAAHNLEPDLILMDIQLNDKMDGITAMQEIRKHSDIPVIYITGNSDQYNFHRAQETDFIDYLIKPIRTADLKASLDKTFSAS